MPHGVMGRESRTGRPRASGSQGGMGGPGDAAIRAKRAASRPERIKEKLDEGADPSDVTQRGYIRLGKSVTRILVGLEDVTTWTDEEIKRGRKRDKNGGWRGRDPVVIPMALHEEAIKRTFEEAQELFREGLVPAVRYLTSIVEDNSVEDKDKLKAVGMILDRVLGKPVERVEINTEPDPWEEVVRVAIVSKPAIEVIETKEVE